MSCIIYARPTMSDMRFVQNIGRGLRAHPGKTDLLILDHSSTTARLGFVNEVYALPHMLDDGKPKAEKKQGVLLPKECPQCHYLKAPRVVKCPNCGHENIHDAKPVAVERGTLREIKPGDDVNVLRKLLPDKAAVFGQLVWYGKRKGYNQWWPNMKFKDIYGVTFPRLEYEDKISPPCPELFHYIVNSTKKWKSQQDYKKRAAAKANGNGHMNGHDHGALSEREQAIIDRVAEQTKGTLMKDDDWEEMR